MRIRFFPIDSDETIDIWEDITVAIPHVGDSVLLDEISYLVKHLHWINKDCVEAYVDPEEGD